MSKNGKHKDQTAAKGPEAAAVDEKDLHAGQTAIPGAEPPVFVKITDLRDRYLSALAHEAQASKDREIAEHMLAERIVSNKNKPFPVTGADGVERKYRSRCRKGADPKELGSLALSEIGASAPATGTEY